MEKSAPFASFHEQDSCHDDPLAAIARYFRSRESPKFFADSGELASLSHRIGDEHAGWRRALLDRVAADRDNGLWIYVRRGPPFRRDFPWGSLEAGPGQDKLYSKRPHRFAFAPRMALAALYGELTIAALEDVLVEWISYARTRNHRFAYDSNLTVIQRVLACSWAWAFLCARTETPSAGELRLEGLLLTILQSDIRFLEPRLGRSFPNNHLLADRFAGWFVGMVWPELAPGRDWRDEFETVWLDELRRQTLRDGTSFEHSTHYHEYACEMASAYILLKRRNGGDVPSWVEERVRRMLEFQLDLGGTETFPRIIGDAAEDPLFLLDSGSGWAPAAWRELYRALIADDITAVHEHDASAEKAFWLLGGALRPPASTSKDSAGRGLRAYPQGGFYLFEDSVADTRLVFRTGPTKGEPIAAGHVHADLLSIYLTIGATPMLVDAGTYTYRANPSRWPQDEPRWRHYFRGPRAHNTLYVDGDDPLGNADGDFRAPTVRAHVEVNRALDGSHATWVDGIFRGDGPYDSYRRGVVHVRDEYWIVYDVVPEMDTGRRRSFGFQFAPGCEVVPTGVGGVAVTLDGHSFHLTKSRVLAAPSCFVGSRDPLGGWVSRRYGHKEPAPQLRFDIPRKVRTSAFLLQHLRDPEAASVDAVEVSSTAMQITIVRGPVRDALLLNFGSRDDVVRTQRDMTFQGQLAWVRSIGGKARVVRWLDGKSLDWPSGGVAISSSKWTAELEVRQTDDGVRARHCELDELSVRWSP